MERFHMLSVPGRVTFRADGVQSRDFGDSPLKIAWFHSSANGPALENGATSLCLSEGFQPRWKFDSDITVYRPSVSQSLVFHLSGLME